MNTKALRVLKAFLKNGEINRDNDIWNDFKDEEVRDEFEDLKTELDFSIIEVSGGRAYLVPNQDNELFSQDNFDFKKSIGSDARQNDIYLLNYLGIYLLYTFFHGEGGEPLNRDFITKMDFIHDFNEQCEKVQNDKLSSEENEKEYGINFTNLSNLWLSKLSGDEDDKNKKIDTKMGCLNRILAKFINEKLFTLVDEKIKPTIKLNDLMPHFLNKDRISDINNLMRGGKSDASN